MLSNCCSSVHITYQCLTTFVVSYLFCFNLALECFSYVKPNPPTVPDLPPTPLHSDGANNNKCVIKQWFYVGIFK